MQRKTEHYYREFLQRVCDTMDDIGYDWRENLYVLQNFGEMDDVSIFKGLCRAVLTTQAVWKIYENKMNEMENITRDFDLNFWARTNPQQIGAMYKEIKEKVRPRDRFLLRKLKAMHINALHFLDAQKQYGSFKIFLEKGLEDKERLIHKLTTLYSKHKLAQVGLAICCEFFKNIGIDEFKPDMHMIRLFCRTKLLKHQYDCTEAPPLRVVRETRKIGWDFATKTGKQAAEVDSILWQFCAEENAEVCQAKSPSCTNCRLRNLKPRLCAGLA